MVGTEGDLAPARVVLIGMMGSGKSSVGRALAARTGWPFLDNDALVERATGRTARELAADGEPALRHAEADALRRGLSLPPPVIVATAAGTVLEPAHREALAGADVVVWLRAPAEILAARAVRAEHRPWLDGDAPTWFLRTLAERDPLYAEIADLEIDTATLDAASAASAILAGLSARG